jgi:hypothetical protein
LISKRASNAASCFGNLTIIGLTDNIEHTIQDILELVNVKVLAKRSIAKVALLESPNKYLQKALLDKSNK